MKQTFAHTWKILSYSSIFAIANILRNWECLFLNELPQIRKSGVRNGFWMCLERNKRDTGCRGHPKFFHGLPSPFSFHQVCATKIRSLLIHKMELRWYKMSLIFIRSGPILIRPQRESLTKQDYYWVVRVLVQIGFSKVTAFG